MLRSSIKRAEWILLIANPSRWKFYGRPPAVRSSRALHPLKGREGSVSFFFAGEGEGLFGVREIDGSDGRFEISIFRYIGISTHKQHLFHFVFDGDDVDVPYYLLPWGVKGFARLGVQWTVIEPFGWGLEFLERLSEVDHRREFEHYPTVRC